MWKMMVIENTQLPFITILITKSGGGFGVRFKYIDEYDDALFVSLGNDNIDESDEAVLQAVMYHNFKEKWNGEEWIRED